MSEDTSKKKLTGRHVLLMLLAFFGIIISVNSYFMTMAVKSFRGEDVKGSYRQGLEYNQAIDARAAQGELGWSVRANLVETLDGSPMLVMQIDDEDGRALTELVLTGTLNHRIDTALDQDVEFVDTGAGRWTANLKNVAGEYTLKAMAVKNDDAFKFQHAVTLK